MPGEATTGPFCVGMAEYVCFMEEITLPQFLVESQLRYRMRGALCPAEIVNEK